MITIYSRWSPIASVRLKHHGKMSLKNLHGHIYDTPPTTNYPITTCCLPLPSALPWDQPPSSWSTPPRTWLQTVSGGYLKNGQYHRKLSTNRFVFGGSGHFLPIAIVHKLNSRLAKYMYTLRMRVTPDRENRFCGTIKPVKNSENGSRADLWRKAISNAL